MVLFQTLIIYLIGGALTAEFSSTVARTCSGTCSLWVDTASAYQVTWCEMSITTSIIAATVVVSIDTDASTTLTSTVYKQLPSGYTLPKPGTRETMITVTGTGGTSPLSRLAFPTPYFYYPTEYTWSGVLVTENTCVTASPSSLGLFTYFTQPGTTQAINSDDPEGLYYFPCHNQGPWWVGSPTEAALIHCRHSSVAPLVNQITARFLTESTTISGGGGSTATTNSAAAPTASQSQYIPLSSTSVAAALTPSLSLINPISLLFLVILALLLELVLFRTV